MLVISALFSAAFLILVAVSAAVTGSTVLLTLFDRLPRGKKNRDPRLESQLDQGRGDLGQGNEDETDVALENIHAEQMRKFGAT
jgi:hypothetical protein